ncbi:hypothetical protein WJX84_002540 [Apatococcus fuscideae]|uniref:NnrU domain-containing protein n=1 Tax=Apatococcus fuscideae TaxID=2026836 RepID=A0AAW1RRE5_9CHLO
MNQPPPGYPTGGQGYPPQGGQSYNQQGQGYGQQGGQDYGQGGQGYASGMAGGGQGPPYGMQTGQGMPPQGGIPSGANAPPAGYQGYIPQGMGEDEAKSRGLLSSIMGGGSSHQQKPQSFGGGYPQQGGYQQGGYAPQQGGYPPQDALVLLVMPVFFPVIHLLVLGGLACPSQGTQLFKWSPQNPGLPTGCLTYKERYQIAKSSSRDLPPLSSTKFIVLLKVHSQALEVIKQDLSWALEALAEEVTSSGYDFQILYEGNNGRVKPRGLSKRLWKACYVYKSQDVFNTYSAIPNLLSGENFTSGPGPRAAQLPISYFMQKHPSYEFAWTIEYDVRLIGHWGKFLDSAFSLASWTPDSPWGVNTELPGPEGLGEVAKDSAIQSYPDLVTFWPFEEHARFSETRVGMEGRNIYSLYMVWGGSRHLFNKMHSYSTQGKTAYIEVFMSTIAHHHNMKYVSIPHAIWSPAPDSGPISYHCCLPGVPPMYLDWYESGRRSSGWRTNAQSVEPGDSAPKQSNSRNVELTVVGEDAAFFDSSKQSRGAWTFFTAELAIVLGILYVVWVDPNTGVASRALQASSQLTQSPELTMLAIYLVFALIHSGGASVRASCEQVIGARAYRVIFAALSLPLAMLAVVYWVNHRYDGEALWNLRRAPFIHDITFLLNCVSFYFLYPSTFNLLEVAAVDEPKVHLWETGIIRITRHPQMVGQGLWCLAHTLWIGSSFTAFTSALLMAHHVFGCWHGDARQRARYGEAFENVKSRTSVLPFQAIIEKRQQLPQDYYKEFLRLPYVTITALIFATYWAHPLIQAGSSWLGW